MFPGDAKVGLELSRFGIQDISEFYGSTEGNSQIINFDNTVGAVGFVPVLFASSLPLGTIKVLEKLPRFVSALKSLPYPQVTEDGEAVRDPDTGLCVRCKVQEYILSRLPAFRCKVQEYIIFCEHLVSFKAGEPGEFVGIIQQHHPVREFTGYSDRLVRGLKICKI